jgi:hypothetical protein
MSCDVETISNFGSGLDLFLHFKVTLPFFIYRIFDLSDQAGTEASSPNEATEWTPQAAVQELSNSTEGTQRAVQTVNRSIPYIHN